MSVPPTTHQIAQEALEEHRQIHFYLDQLTATLTGMRQGLSDVEPMRRLAAQIASQQQASRQLRVGPGRGGGDRPAGDFQLGPGGDNLRVLVRRQTADLRGRQFVTGRIGRWGQL